MKNFIISSLENFLKSENPKFKFDFVKKIQNKKISKIKIVRKKLP